VSLAAARGQMWSVIERTNAAFSGLAAL